MEIANNNLSQNEIRILNDWAGFLSFQPNYIIEALSKCDAKTILVDKGNQGGGTASIVKDYCNRILGLHPIEWKNIRPNTQVRIIRFASETLPTESDDGGEIKNTVYPQFKKFFPPYLIKKDITARRPAVTIRDWQGGRDIVAEFVSYNQEIQAQAGVQRFSIYEDENPPKGWHEEQRPRLLATDGDIIIGLTPAEGVKWIYEDVYCRTRVIYNSPTIRQYLSKKLGRVVPEMEFFDGKPNIAVIRAATDDNPTLDPRVIEEQYAGYNDDQLMEIRRYGIFHQMSGVILKDFEHSIHIISRNEWFPEGIPSTWLHARGIDFHEHVNWAIGWVALSNQNEAFIYDEYNPSPDRMVTMEISRQVALRNGYQNYALNLIDPWAAKKQTNTGLSPLDDMNRFFYEFRREGICSSAYWQTWDTKSAKGRDVIKERLKNSRMVGRPFNNRIVKNGTESYLPTLWILDNCQQTAFCFKNWRWEEWADRESLLTKEEKDKPQDKYSHFPITFECIFKHPAFNITNFRDTYVQPRQSPYSRYMVAQRV